MIEHVSPSPPGPALVPTHARRGPPTAKFILKFSFPLRGNPGPCNLLKFTGPISRRALLGFSGAPREPFGHYAAKGPNNALA